MASYTRRNLLIVRNNQQQAPGFLNHARQHIDHACGSLAVELPGWLIREKQHGLTHHRPGHRDPLPLAARQLGGKVPFARGKANPIKQQAGSLHVRCRGPPGRQHRQQDVFKCRAAFQQMMLLEDKPDSLIPKRRPSGC